MQIEHRSLMDQNILYTILVLRFRQVPHKFKYLIIKEELLHLDIFQFT